LQISIAVLLYSGLLQFCVTAVISLQKSVMAFCVGYNILASLSLSSTIAMRIIRILPSLMTVYMFLGFWCVFFGVSTSGYYTWHKEHPDRQQGLDADGDQIEGIFDESGGT